MADLKASDETAASTVSDTHGWAIEAAGVDKWLTFLIAAGYFQAKLRDTDETLAANSDAKFATQKAVKAYVDSLSAAVTAAIADSINGRAWKDSVRLATIAVLPACTYANGAAGVGATLTGNSNGALTAIDGVTPALNDRILVKDQAADAQNGLYKLTTVGSGGATFVLTRTIDGDSAAELLQASGFIQDGTTNGDKQFVCTTNAAIVVGTTSLAFAVGGTSTSPTTTKGDLIVRGSGADGRLPVGSNGQIPIADSTQVLGIRWDAAPSGGSALPTSATYSPAIVFDGNKFMATQIVAGVIAFTLNTTGAAEGGLMVVDLIADGANSPTFTGFSEWDGSAGYVNSFDVRNTITFFRRDGIYYYSIGHRSGFPAEGLQPVVSGAVLRLNAPTSMTETGNSTSGWNYSSTGSGFTAGGVLNNSFPNGVDGSIEFTIGHVAAGHNTIVGLRNTATWSNAGYSALVGVWVHQGGFLQRADGGSYVATSQGFSTGDKVKLTRSGSNLVMAIDGGSGYSTVFTFTGVPTTQMWVHVQAADTGSTFNNPRGINLT